jgi:hypothetical protein
MSDGRAMDTDYQQNTVFYGEGNETRQLGIGFLHKRITSAVERVEFVSDRMSYIILRGCWCHIIVLNVHAPIEDKRIVSTGNWNV